MKYIEIHLTKCDIIITEQELFSLLSKDIDLYKKILIRGKAFKRNEVQKRREQNIVK